MRGLFLLLPGSVVILCLLLPVQANSNLTTILEKLRSLIPLETSTPFTEKRKRPRNRFPAIQDSEEIVSRFYPPMGVGSPYEQFSLDPTCNSSELREILVQAISETPSDSKHRINAAITRNMEGSFGVVCADCSFSYLAHTVQYCHHTRDNITCLVFRDG